MFTARRFFGCCELGTGVRIIGTIHLLIGLANLLLWSLSLGGFVTIIPWMNSTSFNATKSLGNGSTIQVSSQ